MMKQDAAMKKRDYPQHCASVLLDEVAPRMRDRNAKLPSVPFLDHLAMQVYNGKMSKHQLRNVLDVIMRRVR